ncbi:MAG: Ig-like domain-containing protein [bacterium]|nr:Ig-like domain-containing protein [bacterium]
MNLTFNDGPDVQNEAEGREVVFYRNGAEVGRDITDAAGNAEFTDDCLDAGNYSILAKYEKCPVCFDVCVKEVDCCKFICTGMLNDTERFFLADCFGDSGDVALTVQLQFNECPGEVPVRSGHQVTFSANGQQIGVASTDANGFANFSWDNVQLGNYHIAAVSDHCGTEFDITVHEECAYHACIGGKGKLAGKNGSPYMVFQYEGHVQDGHLEMANTMSLADGDINFVKMPIEWIVVLGLEVYFGNDNIMFHTIDNGMAPGVDFCEVWVFDRGYHNSVLLLNGQIRSSWGLKQPPVAIP